jgi:hypothetical protein
LVSAVIDAVAVKETIAKNHGKFDFVDDDERVTEQKFVNSEGKENDPRTA